MFYDAINLDQWDESCFAGNADLPGHGINPIAEFRDSVKECQVLCKLKVGCVAFTWKRQDRQCFLKGRVNSAVYVKGLVSARKFCDDKGTMLIISFKSTTIYVGKVKLSLIKHFCQYRFQH